MREYRTVYEYAGKNELKGRMLTDAFTSNADSVRVSVSGGSDAGLCVSIFQRDKSGCESRIYSESFGGGRFALEYSFDPISLAVYASAASFFVSLESEGTYVVDKLVAEEEIAQAVKNDTAEAGNGVQSGVRGQIPSHVLFVGNSLVFGMMKTYGMCATAPDKDYFHHVSEYIKKHNPVCRFDKLYGSMYEHAESIEAFEYWYGTDVALRADTAMPAKTAFTSDLDLVFIQLGDNVNTDEKEANFGVTADILIERIKTLCPRARIIWIHGWYNRSRTLERIERLCERWGIERIDMGGIRSIETEAHSQKYYLDVVSGTEKEVSDKWITHPGDLGMKMIADAIIKKLGF